MQQIQASCNGELFEGATDGKVKKSRPNTRVGDYHGDALIMANKAGLSVPGAQQNPYGATPLTQDSGPGKVRPA